MVDNLRQSESDLDLLVCQQAPPMQQPVPQYPNPIETASSQNPMPTQESF